MSFGPRLTLDGSYQDPVSLSKTSPLPPLSSVRAGPNVAVNSLIVGPFDAVNAELFPFFQTDLRGDARIPGASFIAEPILQTVALGTPLKSSDGVAMENDWPIQAYWRLIPEIDFMNVIRQGDTNYTQRNYLWVGANLQAQFKFFHHFPTLSGLRTICLSF